ncbi:MAG: TetR/AcrR family transcriptional regulator [Planctomycetes bacterium]|jgi:AcrR family transcriptional regulator|nr:TetR/AcrR family transcriptional regulator [Planctomycetota bacterium]
MAKKQTAAATRNPQRSKQALIDAGIEVFARLGPNAATIEEICAKASLNKRLAYHYFGGKEGLYEAVLEIVYREFYSLEIELGSMLLPAEKLLQTLVARYHEFNSTHPAFVRLISYENLNEGRTAGRLNLKDQKAPVITALRLALKKGQEEGKFRKSIDVHDLLISIVAMCFFYFSNRHTMALLLGAEPLGPGHMKQRVDHVVELLLNGISVGPGGGKK